jgi:hypothetical protein
MICPKWVYTRIQPIAVADVIKYLISALKTEESRGKIIEIGGADVITYREMMLDYAKVRGLKRIMIPVPVLTPRLSSYWVHIVTPLGSSIAQPLIDGLKNEVIVRNNLYRQIFPRMIPMSYQQSVKQALTNLNNFNFEFPSIDDFRLKHNSVNIEIKSDQGKIIEFYYGKVKANNERVFQILSSLGGPNGWLYLNWIWRIRGYFDKMIGGAGIQYKKSNPECLSKEDVIDTWKVESVEKNHFLLLRSMMRLPGKVWLYYTINQNQNNHKVFVQTIAFVPKGLIGLLYWYMLYPIHRHIFKKLYIKILRKIEL